MFQCSSGPVPISVTAKGRPCLSASDREVAAKYMTLHYFYDISEQTALAHWTLPKPSRDGWFRMGQPKSWNPADCVARLTLAILSGCKSRQYAECLLKFSGLFIVFYKLLVAVGQSLVNKTQHKYLPNVKKYLLN